MLDVVHLDKNSGCLLKQKNEQFLILDDNDRLEPEPDWTV
jgi:hypothetical protein